MMNHHWTNGLKALGLGLMTLAGTASAQTKDLPGPIDSLQDLQDTGRMVFKMIDENNDGQISQKEAVDAADLAVGACSSGPMPMAMERSPRRRPRPPATTCSRRSRWSDS